MNYLTVIVSVICSIFNSVTIYLSNKRKIKNINDSESSKKEKEKVELSTKVEMIIKDIDELKKDYKKMDGRVDEMSNKIVRCEEKLKRENVELI